MTPPPIAAPVFPPSEVADASAPVFVSTVADGRRRAIVVVALSVAVVAIVVGVKSRHAKPSSAAIPAPAAPPIVVPPPPLPAPAPPPQPEIALDPGAPARSKSPEPAKAPEHTSAPATPAEAPAEDGSAADAETSHHHHHHHERHEHHDHERHHARAEHHAATKEHAPKEPKTKAPRGGGDRDAARVAYQRGNGLLLSGDAAGAVAAYQDAVRRAPTDPIGYRGLGLAFEKEGKTSEAIAALVSYLKLSKHARDREVIARRLYRLTHAEDGGLSH